MIVALLGGLVCLVRARRPASFFPRFHVSMCVLHVFACGHVSCLYVGRERVVWSEHLGVRGRSMQRSGRWWGSRRQPIVALLEACVLGLRARPASLFPRFGVSPCVFVHVHVVSGLAHVCMVCARLWGFPTPAT